MFITVTKLMGPKGVAKSFMLPIRRIEHIPMPDEGKNVKIHIIGSCPWDVAETFKELEDMLVDDPQRFVARG